MEKNGSDQGSQGFIFEFVVDQVTNFFISSLT